MGSIVRSGVLSLSLLADRESDWEFDRDTVTKTGLVWLVLSWFRLMVTLSIGGSLGQSGVQLGYWKFDQSGVLCDIELLGDLFGTCLEGRN